LAGLGNATTAKPNPANLIKQGEIVDETPDETAGAARIARHSSSGFLAAPVRH
jgi:hypothetical protein